MPPLHNDPIIDFQDDLFSVCHWGPLQVQFYWKTLTVSHVQKLEQVTEVLARHNPNGYVALSIMQPGIGVPPAEVREAASKILGRFTNERKGAIVVLEYSGAMAQLLISILRGFNIVAGRRQVQICGSLSEAAAEFATVLTPIMGRTVSAGEILGVIERGRQLTKPAAKAVAPAV